MDYGLECKKEEARPKGIVNKINNVRLWKKYILPFEILGIDGNRATSCGEKDDEKSMIKGKFKIPNVEKPNKSCFLKWRHFMVWLRTQETI